MLLSTLATPTSLSRVISLLWSSQVLLFADHLQYLRGLHQLQMLLLPILQNDRVRSLCPTSKIRSLPVLDYSLLPLTDEAVQRITKARQGSSYGTRSQRQKSNTSAVVAATVMVEDRDTESNFYEILTSDFHTLQDGQWLSDIIINGYMALIEKRSADNSTTLPQVWIFTSFFYQALTQKTDVRRWTKRAIDVFEDDKIIFPVHTKKVHWSCACIDVGSREIQYYDSLGWQAEDNLFALVREWMDGEWKSKREAGFNLTGGSINTSRMLQGKTTT